MVNQIAVDNANPGAADCANPGAVGAVATAADTTDPSATPCTILVLLTVPILLQYMEGFANDEPPDQASPAGMTASHSSSVFCSVECYRAYNQVYKRAWQVPAMLR